MAQTDETIMVCVTQQRTCQRLVHMGALMAGRVGGGLVVVHVVDEAQKFLYAPDEGDALEFLYEIAVANGASMVVEKSEDAVACLAECARRHHATLIIAGAAGAPKDESAPMARLRTLLPQANFIIVENDEDPRAKEGAPPFANEPAL